MVEAFVPSSVGSWHLGHEQTNILKESQILGDKGSLILSRLGISNAFFKTQYTYVDFTNDSLPVLWNFKLANDVAVVWPAVLGGYLYGICFQPTHIYKYTCTFFCL